jgi:hypothetical protein
MHPVQFHAENVSPRSRLTTFFRLILAIPHVIFVALYGIVAYVVIIIAWFAILITGRYPTGLWSFVVGFLRYAARVNAYIALIADRFPPFGAGGSYTAELTVQPQERHSRLTTFFRTILAIPALILAQLLGYAGNAVAIIQWLVIVFTARCPDGLHDFQTLVQRFRLRTFCYLALVTDRYPNFDNPPPAAPAAEAPASGWDTGSSGQNW